VALRASCRSGVLRKTAAGPQLRISAFAGDIFDACLACAAVCIGAPHGFASLQSCRLTICSRRTSAWPCQGEPTLKASSRWLCSGLEGLLAQAARPRVEAGFADHNGLHLIKGASYLPPCDIGLLNCALHRVVCGERFLRHLRGLRRGIRMSRREVLVQPLEQRDARVYRVCDVSAALIRFHGFTVQVGYLAQ
jgi:hypothetical protein